MSKKFWCPQLFIPTSFANCLSYAQQINWLYKQLTEAQTTIKELQARVEALENA